MTLQWLADEMVCGYGGHQFRRFGRIAIGQLMTTCFFAQNKLSGIYSIHILFETPANWDISSWHMWSCFTNYVGSCWHILPFSLTFYLMFYLASYLTFNRTYILTFFHSIWYSFLTYILACYPTYNLTFQRASGIYVVSLSGILSDIYIYVAVYLTFYPTNILSFDPT